jgi:hypothetical protein
MHKRIKAIVLWPPPWSQKTLIGRLAAYAYALMVSPLVLAISILSASAYFFAARASRNLSKHEVANTLERFVKNSGEAWEWDDFINGSALRDEALERIRIQCKQLPLIHPPLEGHGYCSAQGLETMNQLVIELRGRVQ